MGIQQKGHHIGYTESVNISFSKYCKNVLVVQNSRTPEFSVYTKVTLARIYDSLMDFLSRHSNPHIPLDRESLALLKPLF